MKCRVCGETLEPQITELPFNLSAKTIVLLKDLPVLRCEKCGEYATLDPVMEKSIPCWQIEFRRFRWKSSNLRQECY
ncbi:YgiT-type zinc finger protein [Leptospirillum ferrooxidans]|uniref:YgiT-type zinc finger protein n=1 Tax=Leptospirillum ferrooxidans TaxID=180 RepID=UPI0005A17421